MKMLIVLATIGEIVSHLFVLECRTNLESDDNDNQNPLVYTPKNSVERHGFVFRREGLFGWKLVDLDFDPQTFAQQGEPLTQ